MDNELRQYAPATERNREPILAVLLKVLPSFGNILEISSGTGEHAIFFAPHIYPRQWIPSEPNPQLRASIQAWTVDCPTDNVYPPLDINVESLTWYRELDQSLSIQAIVNINMIHIASWSACLGLIAGAQQLLPKQGILYLYGPFKIEGKHTAASNLAFDEMLQSQNPDWGVRDLDQVVAVAKQHQLNLLEAIAMPANNLSVIFQRE
ncbi:DUF938 domain-containing protein [Gloeocapsa sp. PCC 73106]|uniref:DUF938 domain-containing protein n=1 Tax=Gloeocapsa sp. PCC 73106 TaxID=102232 RepID=UPI0002AC438C|nr:DUF938 domain-containing protein [Gloeocapsa sp. PCC 73106]ELR97655.1 Protein of unknown function (DUF938) [Gloeocapsa sp. PCC 73106]